MFNVFQNALILKLEDTCNIHNYADDNTVGCKALTKSELCDSIMNVSKTISCNANYMQANPEKFQLIIFRNLDDTVSIEVENEVILKPLECV